MKMMDVNEIDCGHHFVIYTFFKALCCTPKMNTMPIISQ